MQLGFVVFFSREVIKLKFSEKLIKLRKENKLSQEQLASKLDVSRQAVSKWESGQTYPEMDKLLALCKLFKCSLDDLTNDEISKDEMTNNQNKKNSFINFIYEMLEFINKSISMLKSMTFKEIIKMGFELFLLGMFLLFLRLPFALVENFGVDLLYFIKLNSIPGLYEIWILLINMIYFILFTIIFIYIYKVRYLDKYEETEEVIVKYIKDKKNEKVEDKKKTKEENKLEEKVIIKKDNSRSFALFNILGTIMKYIIKFIIVCIGLPFICTLAIIAFLLIVDIILTIKGVVFVGILVGLIFALIFNIMLVEVIFKFIFNMRINFKKIFIMFIVSVIGLGVSAGALAFEATKVKVYDTLPSELEKEITIKELKIKDNSYIFYSDYSVSCDFNEDCYFHLWDWRYNIEKQYDESLKDKVIIEMSYNKDFVGLELDEDNGTLEINNYNATDYNVFVKIFKLSINHLRDKKIYLYDNYKLDAINITITTSKKNHELLDSNFNKKVEEIKKETKEEMRYQNTINEYENRINQLSNRIYELENKYNDLEISKNDEIEKLKEEIEMYKEKIDEYKEKISNLIEE